jgi:uncharacterized protein HemX
VCAKGYDLEMQMPEVMQFDAEVSQQLEATYLIPEIVEQRRLQLAALDLKPGEHGLDIGSGPGPGLLAAQAAAIVGASGSVHGQRQQRECRRRCIPAAAQTQVSTSDRRASLARRQTRDQRRQSGLRAALPPASVERELT